ncbi:Fe-S assembly protein IscX [Kangiella profundi]|uniref:Fe-S assembly protein IscX n=2 Tax=Kangiella TaxID=261963 RepID=A0A2K9AF47_9GAMM|nr:MULTISPECIES: Fe-S cluster assembly protein IscX [Kangiella]AUD79016.1 Fe-S assembly protein IscX [Kangiella profundi]WQG84258.1 Fe-S cluster assembly protein IscX [Kangiella aquimarina]GGF02202.1 Fe-S assembly protein IscX [Kangiella profundi]
MKWIDSLDIAIELYEKHPEVDPKTVNFVDLQKMVMGLEDFDDDPKRCGERILEAIQMAWIEEAE